MTVDDDLGPAWGTVVVEDRGRLPYLLVHGEALVAAAAWSLDAAGVTAVDLSVPWSSVRELAEPFVLHDSLCPLTPPDFIASCVQEAADRESVVVGVRPVTDTVKRVVDGFVGETLDRSGLVSVCSPVVLPGAVVAALEALPTLDFTDLVVALRERWPVTLLEAPSGAARVSGPDDVRVLESLR